MLLLAIRALAWELVKNRRGHPGARTGPCGLLGTCAVASSVAVPPITCPSSSRRRSKPLRSVFESTDPECRGAPVEFWARATEFSEGASCPLRATAPSATIICFFFSRGEEALWRSAAALLAAGYGSVLSLTREPIHDSNSTLDANNRVPHSMQIIEYRC